MTAPGYDAPEPLTFTGLVAEWNDAILGLPTHKQRTDAYEGAILSLALLLACGEGTPEAAQSVLARASVGSTRTGDRMTGAKIETTTLVQLDERTKEELQPPCDAGKVPCFCDPCNGATGRHACSLPAVWVVHFACVCGFRDRVLACTPHSLDAAMPGLCPQCSMRVDPSREALR